MSLRMSAGAIAVFGSWVWLTGITASLGQNPVTEPTPAANQEGAQPQWTQSTAIGQIVADRPQTARIFELLEIDYCCGGDILLGDVAKEKQLDVNRLLAALAAVGVASAEQEQRNWQQAKLGELMDHIVSRHHSWLRRELPLLVETTQTVHRVHGKNHTELKQLAQIVEKLPAALLPHLTYEERTVFPTVKAWEASQSTQDARANREDRADRDKVVELLAAMRSDHDEAGEMLHQIRELTHGFAVPKDACAKYREMLSGLAGLERDMHQHVHLENNVLLPRALRMIGQ